MVKLSTQSKTELFNVVKGSNPTKVIDEGDSLKLNAKIHSFYWPWDGPKKHDYEPAAIINDCVLTRFHYKWLFVWEGFTIKNNKPIVSFLPIWNTPKICTNLKPYFKMPSNLIEKMYFRTFIAIIEAEAKQILPQYQVEKYANKMIDEKVMEGSEFTKDDIKFLVIVSKDGKIDNLSVNSKAKTF